MYAGPEPIKAVYKSKNFSSSQQVIPTELNIFSDEMEAFLREGKLGDFAG